MSAPATTSRMKWLAVATTANAIRAGINVANARTTRCDVARNSRTPSSRFHPAWKLGIAAYSLTSDGGRTVRYASARAVTVSTPRPASRGGATGSSAKTTRPSSPETRQTVRSVA